VRSTPTTRPCACTQEAVNALSACSHVPLKTLKELSVKAESHANLSCVTCHPRVASVFQGTPAFQIRWTALCRPRVASVFHGAPAIQIRWTAPCRPCVASVFHALTVRRGSFVPSTCCVPLHYRKQWTILCMPMFCGQLVGRMRDFVPSICCVSVP